MTLAIRTVVVVAIAVVLWHITCALLHVPRYVFPAPLEVAIFLMRNLHLLVVDSLITAIEALLGLCIGIVISLFSAAVIFILPRSEKLIGVLIVGIQSIPILAIAPFLTSWFGSGIGSKVAASAIVSVFPLIGGWLSGKNSITVNEMIFADSVLPSSWIRFWNFTLPRSLPSFFSALRIACPLSVLGALVGEFVGARRGLGFRILTGSYYLRTEEMLAAVLLACLLSLLFFGIVVINEKVWLFWHGNTAK